MDNKGNRGELFDFISSMTGNITQMVASIWGKNPVNYQPEAGKHDYFKYIVWLILGLAFIFVIYRLFRSGSKRG